MALWLAAATVTETLGQIASDLATIQQTLDEVASRNDATEIISAAASEMTNVIARTRRLAERCATDDVTADST